MTELEPSGGKILNPFKGKIEEDLELFRQGHLPYYRRFMEVVATAKDEGSPSHLDRMHRFGLSSGAIRRILGLSREEVAQHLAVDPIRLAAIEGGLVPPQDFPEHFTLKISMFYLGGLLVFNKLRPPTAEANQGTK